jgi:C-terminal peptidase prc
MIAQIMNSRPGMSQPHTDANADPAVGDTTRRRTGLILLLALTIAIVVMVMLCVVAVLSGELQLTPPPTQPHRLGRRLNSNHSALPHIGSQQARPTTVPTTAPTTAAISPEITARQSRIFDQLWRTVNERYIYPDFNGVDWARVRTETQAQIDAGLTDDAFHTLMSDLINGLKDDHSSFLSPPEVAEEDAEYNGTGIYVGVGIVSDVNIEKRYVFVLTILPGGPAEAAGIRPHDHLLEIDGQPSVDENGETRTRLLRGEAGTTVTVLVRTPGQDARTVHITRGKVTSIERIQHRLLSDTGKRRIGYVLLPSLFEEDVSRRTRAALQALMRSNGGKLDGLVLDLRTNGGGTYGNLRDVLGFFTSGRMGSLTNRFGDVSPIRARAERVGNSQTVPLVVLIGPGTESYAEVLAGALQAKGRAVILGKNSAGNVETLLMHNFEDGSRLWLAEETFVLPNDTSFESVGVTPNMPINIGWDEHTDEDDPVIAAAVTRLTQ